MKKAVSLFLLITVLSSLFLVSCKEKEKNVWDGAKYTENTTLGEGAKQVTVEVKALEKSVTFVINTDREILGDALLDNSLIDGDKGEFGLYVKFVNGIEADFDKDQSYWAFYKNGEMMMVGVDSCKFENGEKFELVYTK